MLRGILFQGLTVNVVTPKDATPASNLPVVVVSTTKTGTSPYDRRLHVGYVKHVSVKF
jgi:hypothetical protein